MAADDLRERFNLLKVQRRVRPRSALDGVGALGRESLRLLATTTVHPFAFKGHGSKKYLVATRGGDGATLSRAMNERLLIRDAEEFEIRWANFAQAVVKSAGRGALKGVTADEVDALVYSAVIAYAAVTDLFTPGDRGGPGSFLEMVVGPVVSLLSGREEAGAVTIPLEGSGESETITTDLSFADTSGRSVLIIPTKISTRERISQAYVHQLILERAGASLGTTYRSVLVVANENNTMFQKLGPKNAKSGWTQETLVPGTIVLYQKYVAQLSGVYYLDPPVRYVETPPTPFPRVATFGQLLTTDLPALLGKG